MSRKTSEKESASHKAPSSRATVGSYPVLNPATRSKVGGAKLAKAVNKVWNEKRTSATAVAGSTRNSSAASSFSTSRSSGAESSSTKRSKSK